MSATSQPKDYNKEKFSSKSNNDTRNENDIVTKKDSSIITVITPEEEEDTATYVPGGILIQICSMLLLLSGIAEVSAGAVVIATSHAHFVGGVYVGLAAFVAGLRGLFLRHGGASVIGTFIFSALAAVVGLIGAVLQARMLNFLLTLQACATPASIPSTQCNTASPVYYTCTGDKAAYDTAYVCARNSDNNYNNDDNNSKNRFNSCTCVTNTETSTAHISDDYSATDDLTGGATNSGSFGLNSDNCYQYDEFGNCDTLLNTVPQQVQVAYLLAVLCVMLAGVVCIFCVVALLRPKWFVFLKPKKISSNTNNTDNCNNNTNRNNSKNQQNFNNSNSNSFSFDGKLSLDSNMDSVYSKSIVL